MNRTSRASSQALRRSDGSSRGKPNPRRDDGVERPGRRAWLDFPKIGPCEGCSRRGRRQAHHALLEQKIKQHAPERTYDLANRVLLGISCGCHAGHHHPGTRDTRLPRSKLRPETLAFIREILGTAADEYLSRYYRAG